MSWICSEWKDGNSRCCIVQKVVHPFSEYARSIKNRRTDLTVTGNKGVWVWKKRLGKYTSPEH